MLSTVALMVLCCSLTATNAFVFSSDGVCGHSRYDANFNMCCGDTIQSKSGIHPSCCGTRGYDAAFNMCCGDTIQSKSGINPSCCGTRGYDAAFNMCCNGVVC